MRNFVTVVGLVLAVATATLAAETVTGEVIDTFCFTSMGAKGNYNAGGSACGHPIEFTR
jgi:hypothetical protein